MGTARIIPFPSCGMPVRARCATRSVARRIGSQEKHRSLRLGPCLCSRRPLGRLRPRAWASTRSSFISTTIMSWGSIRGSSCGIGVRARSARRCVSARGRQPSIAINIKPQGEMTCLFRAQAGWAIHLGAILHEEFLEPMSISPNRLAHQLHISTPTINDIVLERRVITPETALLLARYFGTSEQFWLNLRSAYDLKRAAK